ncbi:ATP-binding protein [Virgibacillus sp. W0181]|uniref:sensor histidine kinase n=1 Tax=Virgibacillus sp. W0181 TaxID=3391581 RepID=UPI003F45780A
MKLRTKIQLFTSLFMIILIAAINSSIYFLFYNISANQELDELAIHTNTIVETLNKNADIPEKELLQAFLPANGTIQVIKENGSLLIPTLTKKETYRNIPKAFSNKESRSVTRNEDGINIAIVNRSIVWKDGGVVTLQVSEHLISLKETMSNLFYVLLLASLLILIPTILAGNILGRFLLKPIQALIQAMKENTRQEEWQKIRVNNRSHDELYEMKQTFNNMIDHLRNNFEKQEQFVSNASHELKTPISIVKSYAQLLKRRGKAHPELFDESVQSIESEADRMQHLVEQMLMLAKNKRKEDFEQVNLVKLCKSSIKTFQHAYDRVIYFDFIDENLIIQGDPGQIEQVIYILLDNALKYSESEINIVLSKEENKAVLHVKDKGPGMALAEQEQIFERFYRIDTARSRDTGGTGLGLAIAKAIVTGHAGQLTVCSEIGEGSTFTVKLPLS